MPCVSHYSRSLLSLSDLIITTNLSYYCSNFVLLSQFIDELPKMVSPVNDNARIQTQAD